MFYWLSIRKLSFNKTSKNKWLILLIFFISISTILLHNPIEELDILSHILVKHHCKGPTIKLAGGGYGFLFRSEFFFGQHES